MASSDRPSTNKLFKYVKWIVWIICLMHRIWSIVMRLVQLHWHSTCIYWLPEIFKVFSSHAKNIFAVGSLNVQSHQEKDVAVCTSFLLLHLDRPVTLAPLSTHSYFQFMKKKVWIPLDFFFLWCNGLYLCLVRLIGDVLISHTDTPHSVRLLRTRDRPTSQGSLLHNTQHTQQTDKHVTDGIRTRNPKQVSGRNHTYHRTGTIWLTKEMFPTVPEFRCTSNYCKTVDNLIQFQSLSISYFASTFLLSVGTAMSPAAPSPPPLTRSRLILSTLSNTETRTTDRIQTLGGMR